MNRRRFLSFSALSIFLPGCLERTLGTATEDTTRASRATATGSPETTATETETSSSEGATPECWPSMCEGTKLVEVVVAYDFSGDVVLNADCRTEEFAVPSGESVQIDREEDAETCSIDLSADGETVFSERIDDYESLTLTVNSNGEVDDDRVVY